jgi:hypothetical protein
VWAGRPKSAGLTVLAGFGLAGFGLAGFGQAGFGLAGTAMCGTTVTGTLSPESRHTRWLCRDGTSTPSYRLRIASHLAGSRSASNVVQASRLMPGSSAQAGGHNGVLCTIAVSQSTASPAMSRCRHSSAGGPGTGASG